MTLTLTLSLTFGEELVLPLAAIQPRHRRLVGGKALNLARMAHEGLTVPDALCITTAAYDAYLDETGLRERLALELTRKPFEDMRWEELWDASLRIRHMFATTPLSPALEEELRPSLERRFAETPVAVRSSAPDEDTATASFAGLHESFLNISSTSALLDHIRLVWASLWSDAALLYRQELELDVLASAIAVMVQEVVLGERSGIVFGVNPMDPTQTVIEAVYGLNEGLVDGRVEPDRYIMDREHGELIAHHPAARKTVVRAGENGTHLVALDPALRERAPLDGRDRAQIVTLAMRAQRLFGAPQDVEWTIRNETLYTLQSRPITSGTRDDDEETTTPRSWYLSLRRSYDNLMALGEKIEDELLPAMAQAADALAARAPSDLDDRGLADALEHRAEVYAHWKAVYWDEFIPFAHGMRLFGQLYNDTVRPDDPYEFVELLQGHELLSVERNRMLGRLAAAVRADDELAAAIAEERYDDLGAGFCEDVERFLARFGDTGCGSAVCFSGREAVYGLIAELAGRTEGLTAPKRDRAAALEAAFLASYRGEQRQFAASVLALGRDSYRLRDDDNIYLGRIEHPLLLAQREAARRLAHRDRELEFEFEFEFDHIPSAATLARALREPNYRVALEREQHDDGTDGRGEGDAVHARQLTGQPAGPGIAHGRARVVTDHDALFRVKRGEVLVCDAVEPNMTFVIPLVSAIVERRGGMLIHGAIIAREYGLPCVTGIPDATRYIDTGMTVTVDGYLGIVVIGERGDAPTAADADTSTSHEE